MTKRILVGYIGSCEHCGAILDLSSPQVNGLVGSMLYEKLERDYVCPKCRKILSEKSTGFRKIAGGIKRYRWIGPNREWQSEPPIEDFLIGEFLVVAAYEVTIFF